MVLAVLAVLAAVPTDRSTHTVSPTRKILPVHGSTRSSELQYEQNPGILEVEKFSTAAVNEYPNGKAKYQEKFEYQRYPPQKFRTRFLWARLENKVLNFWKRPKKTNLGPMLGQHRLEKNSGRSLVRSGEIPSPRQTSINKTNDCVMNSEQSALVRGSDPP